MTMGGASRAFIELVHLDAGTDLEQGSLERVLGKITRGLDLQKRKENGWRTRARPWIIASKNADPAAEAAG